MTTISWGISRQLPKSQGYLRYWVQGVPEQFVFTASGKTHDMKATAALKWSAGWTYLFDRGYFSFDLLTTLLNVGGHFVIRLKRGVEYRIIRSNPIPISS